MKSILPIVKTVFTDNQPDLSFLKQRGYTVFRVTKGLATTTDAEAVSEPCINFFACPAACYAELAS